LERTIELLRCLLRAAVAQDDDALAPAVADAARGASDRDWAQCRRILEQNRLLAPMGEAVVRCGLSTHIAEPLRSVMQSALDEKTASNRARLSAYGALLVRLRENGVEPVMLKSAALVALGAAGLGSGMNDVDILVTAAEMPVVEGVLREAGYRELAKQPHASDWSDPAGDLRLDLHHHFGLFEGTDPRELTVDKTTDYPGIDRVRVFEPSAMLVHLAIHLNEHRREFGIQLRWLLDIGYLLRTWGDELRWGRIAPLLRTTIHRVWLLRTVRFFDAEFGMPLPAALAGAAAAVFPLSLSAALRSQRIDPWRLHTADGRRELALCALGRRELDYRIFPRPGDPIAWFVERFRDRRSYALVQRARDRAAGLR
jgi:hypothetical protein